MCRELDALRQSVSDYAASFDANSLTPAQAGEVVRLCARMEGPLTSIKTMAAARHAESESWKHEGFRSPAEQLAAHTGTSTGHARRALETGRRLVDQPQVAAAALAGGLSPDQAAAVADGAAANPARTSDLLEKARHSSLTELQQEVARAKAAVTDLEARRRAIHAKRHFRRYTDMDGAAQGRLYGNPEDAVMLTAAIDPIRRALIVLRRELGHPNESLEALDYDALLTLAKAAIGGPSEIGFRQLCELGLFPDAAQPPDEPGASPKKRRKKLAGSETKVFVHVELDALLRGVALEGELCEMNGIPVPVSVIEDLAANGNTFLVAALTRNKELVALHHFRRRPSAHQRSGLEFIYPDCAVKGCTAKAGLQNDHREDWSRTHFTYMELMDRLCVHHHNLKTRQNWALVAGKGKRAFVPPDHPQHPRNAQLAAAPP